MLLYHRYRVVGSSRWGNKVEALHAAKRCTAALLINKCNEEEEDDHLFEQTSSRRRVKSCRKNSNLFNSDDEEEEEDGSLIQSMVALAVTTKNIQNNDDSPLLARTKRSPTKKTMLFDSDDEENDDENEIGCCNENEDSEDDALVQSMVRLVVDLTQPSAALPVCSPLPTRRHKSLPRVSDTVTPAHWKSKRDVIVRSSYKEFNEKVFNFQLDEHMKIEWSTRLRKTAGVTFMSKKNKMPLARVELATKVLTSEARLKATLLHERCHVASWVIDGVSKPPHGATFKKWADKCFELYPDLQVTTCHNYEIQYKYIYRCENYPVCKWQMGRHSKSVNVRDVCCGRCRGKIMPPLILGKDGQPHAAKALTAYQCFAKEQFQTMKNSGLSLGEKTKLISSRWKKKT